MKMMIDEVKDQKSSNGKTVDEGNEDDLVLLERASPDAYEQSLIEQRRMIWSDKTSPLEHVRRTAEFTALGAPTAEDIAKVAMGNFASPSLQNITSPLKERLIG